VGYVALILACYCQQDRSSQLFFFLKPVFTFRLLPLIGPMPLCGAYRREERGFKLIRSICLIFLALTWVSVLLSGALIVPVGLLVTGKARARLIVAHAYLHLCS